MSAEPKTWDIFLFYAADDLPIIREIAKDLQQRELSCWIDDDHIRTEDPMPGALEHGLNASKVIIACFSPKQLQAGWRRPEYAELLNRYFRGEIPKLLYPVLLDDVPVSELPQYVQSARLVRYSDRKPFRDFLFALKRQLQPQAPAKPDSTPPEAKARPEEAAPQPHDGQQPPERPAVPKYQITSEDTTRIHLEYKRAQDYQQSNPKACLYTSRLIAEDICKQLLQAEMDVSPRGMNFYTMIKDLKAQGVVPQPIAAPLSVIQNFGNVGAHSQGQHAELLTPEYVKPCVDSVGIVVKWYLERYPFPIIEPAVVPEPSEQIRNFLPVFIHDQFQQGNFAGKFEALTLFVDAVGFTKMTEDLMPHGPAGAEELAGIMNSVFEPLIQAVYAQGGFIAVFAGDAFSAIFPAQAESSSEATVLRGLACLARLQSQFERGIHKTKFGQFTLEFKVGLSYGEVTWGIVGEMRKAYYFAGEALQACATVQQQAAGGQILFDDRLGRQLGALARTCKCAWKTARTADGQYQLHEIPPEIQAQFPAPQPAAVAPDQKILACFVPENVFALKDAGEFRNIAAVFLAFQTETADDIFRAWGALLLEQVTAYGGYLSQFDLSDKGHAALCLFGAPLGLEDPVDRALDCFWSLRRKVSANESRSGLNFRAGLAYGLAYAGIVGGKQQCAYTCYSTTVNLAARVMGKAEWGDIRLPLSAKKTELFSFTPVGELIYQGFTEPIPTARVFRRKYGVRKRAFAERLIGRQEKLQILHDKVAPIFQGKFGEVVTVHGEAGIGKSHLTETLRQEVTEQYDVNWFLCPVDSILRKPFNPLITFFNQYFELSPDAPEPENKARFEEIYEALLAALDYLIAAPEEEINADFPVFTRERGWETRAQLERTKSVIGGLLELRWPGSLWEDLDAKGKHENTLQALTAFFIAHSLFHATVIELEDGHNIDPWSRSALEALTRQIMPSPVPLLILCTSRSRDDGSKVDFGLPDVGEYSLSLDYLAPERIKEQAEMELEGVISPELHAWLSENTRGNPFFVQQALRHFKDLDIIVPERGVWQLRADRSHEVPDTIENLLIARLDRLGMEVKEAVKTASVIGREFDIQLLSAVLQRELREDDPIVLQARQAHIWDVNLWDLYQQIIVIFKHALFRDAAYRMLLITQRKTLHQVTAQAIEELYAWKGRLEHYVADLAFHYEQAENIDKAIEYLAKAGDQAKDRYQHQQALNFYDRLLTQLCQTIGQSDREIETLLKRAEVLELTGELQPCWQAREAALRLAEDNRNDRLMGQATLGLGDLWTEAGEHEQALAAYDRALHLLQSVNDRAGLARVLRSQGIVHRRQGSYDRAMTCFQQALALDEEVGDVLGAAKNINNMGMIEDMKGDYDAAMARYRQCLRLLEDAGDKLNMPKLLNNMGVLQELQGQYDAAMASYQDALASAQEVGDRLQIATEFGNIGLVYKLREDYAQAISYFDRAIVILRALDNPHYLCSGLIDKAEALFLLERAEEAAPVNAEGLRLAEKVHDAEYVFKGKVLASKLTHDRAALERMLAQTEEEEETAGLHYELWKMTGHEDHRQTAMRLYQELSAHTPKIEYQKRVEEMGNPAFRK